ncbi:MAG TPA: methyltransferase domain-containing protein [Pirellulales bacterium]|nr:methyltransferase domain-containing protein [Pirellulales bacterium]
MNDDRTLDYEPGVLRVLQSKEQTRHYYNKIARVYDLMSEEAEQPMREAGVKKLAPRPGERILEIGFGTGHSLVQIARAVGPGGEALGVDISDEMLKHAQDLLAKEHLADRAELHCGDAEQLPFKADTLDGIFFSFTLELFDTPELPKVLAECKRVLRPAGRIVVVAVSREGKHGVMLNLYEWTHKHFPNLMDCRPIYVRRALEAAGFTIKDADVESMWVPVEIVLAVKTN